MSEIDNKEVVHKMLKLMRPHKATNHAKVRFGSANDGGYVFLEDALDTKIVYSLGICDDVRFDKELAENGAHIYQYDHTIEALPDTHPNFHWTKCGIAHSNDLQPDLRRIDTLMWQNGHENAKDILLKMDIEGWEWPSLSVLDAKIFSQFKQIALEIHWLHKLVEPDFAARAYSIIEKIMQSHKLIHIHGNNNDVIEDIYGFKIPRVMELTLANSSKYDLVPSNESFPTKLDSPCHPDLPDLEIGQWIF